MVIKDCYKTINYSNISFCLMYCTLTVRKTPLDLCSAISQSSQSSSIYFSILSPCLRPRLDSPDYLKNIVNYSFTLRYHFAMPV